MEIDKLHSVKTLRKKIIVTVWWFAVGIIHYNAGEIIMYQITQTIVGFDQWKESDSVTQHYPIIFKSIANRSPLC